MRYLLLLLVFATGRSFAQDTAQYVIRDRTNSPAQEKKPYVILISADGFRYDLADKYQAPNLLRLREQGVQAAYMQPSFPSLTFPNHYTLVTGLYPAHHGLVDNRFYDPAKDAWYAIRDTHAVQDSSWYGGTPLWVLAEQEHMLSASYFWVASEAAIQGVRPTYYYHFHDVIPIDQRVQAVRDWLQQSPETRPHFITFYFSEVDHAEHRYGPDSWQTKAAVMQVDASVGKLVSAVSDLGLDINFIFLADHGMTTVDTLHPMSVPAVVDTNKFTVAVEGTMVHLYAHSSADIKPTFKALKALNAKEYNVYLATDVPDHLHYSKRDDRFGRIGDILLIPTAPHVFAQPGHAPYGEHGFDPLMPDMRATFYAWGPAFKPHTKIAGFENVDVYPLVAKILGLDIVDKIDGKLGSLGEILR